MKLDFLSSSRINQYLRCPQQFYYRQALGLKVEPAGAAVLGSAFHKAIEVNYRGKMLSREDMAVDDVLDVFSTQFDEASLEAKWQNETPGEAKDSGVKLLSEYQETVAPSTQPLEVERHFKVNLADDEGNDLPWRLEGTIDLLTESREVIDTKTTSRRIKNPRDEHVLQLALYCTALRTITKETETLAAIDYAVRGKNQVILRLPVKHREASIDYFWALLPKVAAAIEAEIWTPNRANFLCSRKWCGYWALCEQTNKGRVRN